MTALLADPAQTAPWGSMPGWGVVADLTPPELVSSRRLHRLRRVLVIALALVIVLCGAGYGWALHVSSSASDAVSAAQDRSAGLAADQHKYRTVMQIQNTKQGIDDKLAALTSTQVDVAGLLVKLRVAVPGSVSLTSVTVTLTAAASGTDTTPSLSTSTDPTIGTVTMTGSSRKLADLADYVTALSRLRGVVNVVPSTNTASAAGGAHWNLTLQLTGLLYTHHPDATSPAGGH